MVSLRAEICFSFSPFSASSCAMLATRAAFFSTQSSFFRLSEDSISVLEASRAWYCFLVTQEERAIHARAKKLRRILIMCEDSRRARSARRPLFTCVADWTSAPPLKIQLVIKQWQEAQLIGLTEIWGRINIAVLQHIFAVGHIHQIKSNFV